ncbi:MULTISPECIES: metal-dependent hydrolase [Leptolyngbya]|uniref:metal-dependent hydrolase n=1 Tax=Leptolyngbya TaxID=47251 RepID=UPI001F54AAF9|nr:metal-dependent hydrolase [Leptolyngbya sp. FACHB-1624]
MMSLTHATIAVAGTSLILSTADPLTLGLALIGSQLPDLDTTTSTIGQICFPISTWLESRYPHRTITHSFLATGLLAAIALPFGYWSGHLTTSIALPLGHLLACFSDCFTKQGVQLFYPYPAWCISVSNPKRRLTTGGTGEYWVLLIAGLLLVVGLHIGSAGGITEKLTASLGMVDGAVEVYNQKSASYHVWADVKGIWASDRTRADDRYFIVANEGDSFIVTDGKGGFFKTGQQILTERIAATIGNPATTQLQTISFMDEEIAPKLQEVAASQPNALILLSGSIVVDLPENVRIPIEANRLQTAKVVDKTVTMTFHPIEAALQQLGEQYVTGTLTVKVISPRPM